MSRNPSVWITVPCACCQTTTVEWPKLGDGGKVLPRCDDCRRYCRRGRGLACTKPVRA